jgi:hypothetical protein
MKITYNEPSFTSFEAVSDQEAERNSWYLRTKNTNGITTVYAEKTGWLARKIIYFKKLLSKMGWITDEYNLTKIFDILVNEKPLHEPAIKLLKLKITPYNKKHPGQCLSPEKIDSLFCAILTLPTTASPATHSSPPAVKTVPKAPEKTPTPLVTAQATPLPLLKPQAAPAATHRKKSRSSSSGRRHVSTTVFTSPTPRPSYSSIVKKSLQEAPPAPKQPATELVPSTPAPAQPSFSVTEETPLPSVSAPEASAPAAVDIAEENIFRVISWRLFNKPQPSREDVKKVALAVEKLVEEAKKENNEEISVSPRAIENGILSFEQFPMALDYLLLTDKIGLRVTARNYTFRINVSPDDTVDHQPKLENNLQTTKEFLQRLGAHMDQNVKTVPQLEPLDPSLDKKTLAKLLDGFTVFHYNDMMSKHGPQLHSLDNCSPAINPYLDFLTKKEVISGWLTTGTSGQSRKIALFPLDQVTEALKDGEWRTLSKITAEETFREQNHIELDLSSAPFSEEIRREIAQCIQMLNTRTSPKPAIFEFKKPSGNDMTKILAYLAENQNKVTGSSTVTNPQKVTFQPQ